MGRGRNLEVHHTKDWRKMKWNFGWKLPENVRYDKTKTSQEKYHEHQTNVENDEEGWNDRQYRRQQINQEE